MSRIETAGRISQYWTSQAAAREIVAEHGCKVCTWKFPGEIFDVAGDLWCEHCAREASLPGDTFIDGLEPALIPTP
jgi:hypothetical protein